MIDFKLWLEIKRTKRKKRKISNPKKFKPVPKTAHDMDAWLTELDLLAKDLRDLQQAQNNFKLRPKKIIQIKKNQNKDLSIKK